LLTKDLLFLELRGGETFLVPEVKQVLSNIRPDIAKKITLMLSTNGTILPDETWTKIFKKFKRTKVNVSIDAYGDDNHYIRYPADWKRILKTIDYLQTHGIKFIITTVVSNLNILLLDKLMKWIQSNQYLNYAYVLEEPAHFRPTNLPKSLLDLAMERLHNIDRNNFANKDTGKDIDNLIDMCKNPGTAEDWQRFCTEIQMRDKFRKINIVNVIPEIKEYMNA
jgi:MoaA/NifB/PqqE/SkfB family radical SAM enzyme